jgi:hypothetical protein
MPSPPAKGPGPEGPVVEGRSGTQALLEQIHEGPRPSEVFEITT